MNCRILLFAQLAEAVGARELELQVDAESTVTEALDQLASDHSSIAMMRANIAVAINDSYATPTTPLSEGCTLALIPPVSGG
ncbi:MAG: molybdopterin converting factor subunit 1 [Planctomycetota bacterium]|nr:molybdopterin converting factor subunit 1 [Planctomycetota bacterium]